MTSETTKKSIRFFNDLLMSWQKQEFPNDEVEFVSGTHELRLENSDDKVRKALITHTTTNNPIDR